MSSGPNSYGGWGGGGEGKVGVGRVGGGEARGRPTGGWSSDGQQMPSLGVDYWGCGPQENRVGISKDHLYSPRSGRGAG